MKTRNAFALLMTSILLASTISTTLSPQQAEAKEKEVKPKPIRVILDEDSAFEATYAILVLAAASQTTSPPVKLIGITTASNGEAYCNNSNGYPDFKKDIFESTSSGEGTVEALTQKILSIAKYDKAKIYSGCDEETAVIAVPNKADSFGNLISGAETTPVRFQLPVGGIPALAPCLFHQEFVFSPNDVVCWNEFNRTFRDETIKYILPTAKEVLQEFQLPELNLVEPKKKASVFLAESMCKAYREQNPLTIVSVGPVTNLARAYLKIQQSPDKYGCPRRLKLSALSSIISTRYIGGVWDENKADNFDANGNYRLNEPYPVWTVGNIYFQDGSHVFGDQHLPYPGTEYASIQTGEHKQAFNSLNNAEANFWIDATAVDKILSSGIPVYIVPLNATNFARLKGFADRLQNNPGPCATAPAQYIKKLQQANQPTPGVFVYDSLFFWDTLAVTSLWNDFVNFEDFHDLEVTTLTNGDPTTVTGQLPAQELFRRDIGTLFRRGRVNHPVKLGLSVNPAAGDPDFSTTIQNTVFSLVCTAQQ